MNCSPFCQKRPARLFALLSLIVMTVATFGPFATSSLRAQTANPLASDSAKAVLQYLRGLKSKSTNRVLIGQDLGHGSDTIEGNYQEYIANVEQATQQGIGLIGGDYGLDPNHQYWVANARFIQHWQRGGLVTISWHFDNPWKGGNSWNTERNEDLDELLQPGSEAADNWQAQLEEIAVQLKPLRDAGVPVLFRPFHEANGDWFWWGKKQNMPGHEEAFKRLYRDMFNYLTYEEGLNNLLWVYSAAVTYEQSIANYYPGADFVDIIGIDVYDDAVRLRDVDAWGDLYNGGHDHYNDLRILAEAGNHPMGLTEIGRNHGTAPNDWYDYRQVINALRGRQEIVFSLAWHSYGDQYGYELHALADHHYLWESLNDPIVANLDDIELPEVGGSVEGTIRLRNSWTGQYLTATSNLPKKYVEAAAGNSAYWSQHWVVEPTNNPDIVRLRCRWKHANHPSNYLHAIGTSAANNSRVRAWPSLTNNRQKWELERVEGNVYRIRNVFKNRYLNANQDGLVTNYNSQQSWYSQRWVIESVE